jgi:hypothetical protein
MGSSSLHTAWLFQAIASFPTAFVLGINVFDSLFSPYYLNIYRFITYTFNTVSGPCLGLSFKPQLMSTALRLSHHLPRARTMEPEQTRCLELATDFPDRGDEGGGRLGHVGVAAAG